ncbi:MAG: hypothetical protein OXI96_10135 [Acidimicrobiaceae bacterium]|nr:hypothetical protein [Acidimicrobiaceae bacterium]
MNESVSMSGSASEYDPVATDSLVSVCSPVDVVLEGLESAGFQKLPKPLVIGSVAFDFDAAATGTGASHDLVVVGGQATDPPQLVQLLSGLNRSLDRFESRRPVSAIVLGVRPEAATLHELENSARLMLIESLEPTLAEVQAAISVLLPLELPETMWTSFNPLDELLASLGDEATDEHRRLIDAARMGSKKKVRETFRLALDDAIRQGSGEGAYR